MSPGPARVVQVDVGDHHRGQVARARCPGRPARPGPPAPTARCPSPPGTAGRPDQVAGGDALVSGHPGVDLVHVVPEPGNARAIARLRVCRVHATMVPEPLSVPSAGSGSERPAGSPRSDRRLRGKHACAARAVVSDAVGSCQAPGRSAGGCSRNGLSRGNALPHEVYRGAAQEACESTNCERITCENASRQVAVPPAGVEPSGPLDAPGPVTAVIIVGHRWSPSRSGCTS